MKPKGPRRYQQHADRQLKKQERKDRKAAKRETARTYYHKPSDRQP